MGGKALPAGPALQVRCMAAVLFMVGRGEEDPSIVAQLLDIEAQPRKPQVRPALAISSPSPFPCFPALACPPYARSAADWSCMREAARGGVCAPCAHADWRWGGTQAGEEGCWRAGGCRWPPAPQGWL